MRIFMSRTMLCTGSQRRDLEWERMHDNVPQFITFRYVQQSSKLCYKGTKAWLDVFWGLNITFKYFPV